jgi:hypothetical protein
MTKFSMHRKAGGFHHGTNQRVTPLAAIGDAMRGTSS